MTDRLRVGVLKLASCDGCQLMLLKEERAVPGLAARFELRPFSLARSLPEDGARLDVGLVEGSVSTEAQRRALLAFRERSACLVALGTCAHTGGVQALRNAADHDTFARTVYPQPELLETLATATPLTDHVTVDIELPGCPVDAAQLLELLTALSVGRRPALRREAVCAECKRRRVVCVRVAAGTPCLGPITRGGCGALCPAFGRGCYGCFGPAPDAPQDALRRTRQSPDAPPRHLPLFTPAPAASQGGLHD